MEDRGGDLICTRCGARERDCPGDCDTGYRPRDGSRGAIVEDDGVVASGDNDPTRHGFGVIDTPTPRYAEELPLRERWARDWSPSGDRKADQVWVRLASVTTRREYLDGPAIEYRRPRDA